ncbi:MAG: hypothetical protein IJ814_03215 [Paludibacteraceae bacterium]|nr:hypothetical protein [Paludibacteraceae bacterium]
MKKIFFLAAMCVALTANAAVIDLDLSKAKSYSTAGSSTFEYSEEDGVLTVNWTVSTGWEVSGIQIPLRSLTGITGLMYEYQGDGSEHAFLHYFCDEQGTFWWDPQGWFDLKSTEWQQASLTPGTALWSSPSYEFGGSPIVSLSFVANPENPTSGTFKLRNVKLVTSGENIDPTPEGQSLPLTYKGDVLPINTEFTRTMSGQIGKHIGIPEVSGIACSRVTPGYIWMQSDETDANTNPFIVATDETGTVLGAKVSFDHVYRWDWEDMCGGVYNNTNYLFIGGFGDNNHTDGEYCIIWFEEPAIDPANPNISVQAHRIKFAYPDGRKHNCESMMYDNIEQKLYIVTKVYDDVNQVFSLPFRLDYGDTQQTLTYVCDLGVTSDIGEGEYSGATHRYKGFHLATAADISPDGRYILIKNHNNYVAIYSWILYWERVGNESIAQTLQNRQPQVIDCYEYEWQGEAIAWRDNNTFYTTSDSDIASEPPIYKYVRDMPEGVEQTSAEEKCAIKQLVLKGNALYLRVKDALYSLDGRRVE